MLMPDRPLEPSKMMALGLCVRSGLRGTGHRGRQPRRSEAGAALSHSPGFVRKGEDDIAVLHRRAVIHFRNTALPGG